MCMPPCDHICDMPPVHGLYVDMHLLGTPQEWACDDYWVPEKVGLLGRLQSWYSFHLLLRVPFEGYAVG